MTTWPARWRAAARFCSLGGHVLRESIAPAKALLVTDVPGSHHDITPAWLTAILCKDVPDGRVLGFQPIGGSAGTSTRQGLQLELNNAASEAGIPSRIFTKCTQRLNQRVMMGFSGIILGEVGFYPQIRPQLNIEAPIGYHACLDDASWRSMVLMEDVVASKGARFITTETRITKAQMKDLLSNMARWHGCFWDSPQLRRQLDWLRTPAEFLATIAPLGFRFFAGLGLRRAHAVIPLKLQTRTNDLWDALGASLDLNRRGPQTFLHGDPHIGQSYITNQGNMGYADWQIVMQGGWAFDVAYAIISALTVEDRRAWESELLCFYLDCLHAAGGPALRFDAAWVSYRQNMIYPYFCWLMTIAGPIMPLLPDMQQDSVALDIIERSANAICDLEPLKLIRGDSH